MSRASTVALDIETSGINPHTARIAVVSLFDGKNTAVIHTRGRIDARDMEWLGDKRWVTQNGTQFDNLLLMRAHPDPQFLPEAWDTRIAESLLDMQVRAPKFNLRALLKKHTGRDSKEIIDHTTWMKPGPLTPNQEAYCAADVRGLLHIQARQEAAARRKGWPYAGLPLHPPNLSLIHI